MPVITFHSVIERPEPVKRVIPPKITWINNMTTPMIIQVATGRDEDDVDTTRMARKGSAVEFLMWKFFPDQSVSPSSENCTEQCYDHY